jgi:hypothetical protein
MPSPSQNEAVPPNSLTLPIITPELLRLAAAARILSPYGDQELATQRGGLEVALSSVGDRGFLLSLSSRSSSADFLIDSAGAVFRVSQSGQDAVTTLATSDEVRLVDDVLQSLER